MSKQRTQANFAQRHTIWKWKCKNSPNGNLVLTLQNHQKLSDLTLDPVAHQDELDCDLPCVKKSIQVYEAHPDFQSCILQGNWMLQDRIILLLNNACCFRIWPFTGLVLLKQSIVDLMLEICSLDVKCGSSSAPLLASCPSIESFTKDFSSLSLFF